MRSPNAIELTNEVVWTDIFITIINDNAPKSKGAATRKKMNDLRVVTAPENDREMKLLFGRVFQSFDQSACEANHTLHFRRNDDFGRLS